MDYIQLMIMERECVIFANSTVLSLDDVLVYRHGRKRQETARLVQEGLNRLDGWCQEYKGCVIKDVMRSRFRG